MSFCPFCGKELTEEKTYCLCCGCPTNLALPYPSVKVELSNISLALLGLVLGIASCIFSLIPSLHYLGFLMVLGAVAFSGISLEKLAKKLDTIPLKVLSIIALIFASTGYLLFVFANSHMPPTGGHA
jgi:hypothetical protein